MTCLNHHPVPASKEPSPATFCAPRASRLDRRADIALSERQHRVAERLSQLVAELREKFSPEVAQ
jgi:hypothetical protein